MSTLRDQKSNAAAAVERGESVTTSAAAADRGAEEAISGWQIECFNRVGSTQALARGRPAWSAVVAGEQTAGRGQAERAFVSDPGGLYVTAVLPYGGDPLASRGFALAVGWALREELGRLGLEGLRLRWPNDLMAGARKVGGILVEQGGLDTLLVGIGLNVTNRPWLQEPALATVAGRLADVVPGGALPAPARLTEGVLQAVHRAQEVFAPGGLAGLVPALNGCWGSPREVEIEPAAGVVVPVRRGRFQGIDREGGVVLERAEGGCHVIPAHHIGRLREVADVAGGL